MSAATFEKSLNEDLDLFGPHARPSDADFDKTFKGRPRPRYKYHEKSPNMFPEIHDFFPEYLEIFF